MAAGAAALLRERRAIQAGRRAPLASFLAPLTAELSSPYFGGVGAQPLIGRALRLYWRAVLALLA